MAFAGVISDLFNCGRPRRPQTRDGAKSGVSVTADATRMVVTQDAERNTGIDATLSHDLDTTSTKTPAADNGFQHSVPEDEVSHTGPLEPTAPFDSRPSTRSASTEVDAHGSPEDAPKEAPPVRMRRNPSSEAKPKVGMGKQVEQRFLVTMEKPSASNATPKLSLEDIATSVVHVTPIDSSPITSPVPLAKPDTFEPKIDEQAATPPVDIETELPEKPTSVPTAVSIPQPQEIEPVVREEEVDLVTLPVQTEMPVAPLSTAASTEFLDLPSEIRSLIYEHMVEAEPIRMCRHDDPALEKLAALPSAKQKRQFCNLTQVCRQLRKEFLPVYSARTEYIIDLWTQRANLTDIGTLKGKVAIDIDAACFDMQPIDILPLIRYLARNPTTHCRFASTEGVVFRSIESIVVQMNKLLPRPDGSNSNWLAAVNGPMKRVDLHLFPHEDIRQYYRFRGAEPMLRIVYPSRATEDWMKQSHKCGAEYEAYLEKTGLSVLDMHVVVGHASRRKTNEGRMPLDWRLSYVGSRLSVEQAVRISGTWTR